MDLELRGAGNLLGGEQSGHIHDIGFELYVKLLEETLSELQGQPTTAFEVKVDGLAPGAQLSRRWIDQAAERLVAYKRISRLREEKDLELYKLDLEDRFGRISEDDPDTLRFFEVLKVKLRAQALAVSEVGVDKGQLRLRLSPQTSVDPARLLAWVGGQKGASLSPDGAVRLPLQGTQDGPVIQAQRVLAEWAGWLGG
jgi:transcription-repair coupling factor (superfamily II helicase)